MSMTLLLSCMTAAAQGACANMNGAGDAPSDSFFLAKAQTRIDAVAVGDAQVWRDTLAADGVFDLTWVKAS